MAKAPYDTDLDRNPANFQPLTPLGFLQRSAATFPDHIAIIHGPLRRTYRDFYARARRLASALAKRGIKRGDTVSVVLANTPAMLECHYGVPMSGAVLNTINTRLDAAINAFTLDHAEAKVLIVDREFSKTMKEALARCKVKPLVIDYDDPEFAGDGERLGTIEYEEFLQEGDPDFAWADAGRRMGRDFAQLHLGHDRRSQGRGLSPPRRLPARHRQHRHLLAWASIRSICGRCRCSIATAGAFPGRFRSAPARMSVCARCGRRRCTTPSPTHKVTHLCGAPIVMATLLNAPADEKKPLPHVVEFLHRRGAAAGSRSRRDEGGRLQRHASLWTDGKLRSGRRQRLARGMGHAAARRAGGEKGAPGRALWRARRARRDGSRNHEAGAARRRDDRRSDDARQCRDEGLSQEQGGNATRPSPAAGSTPAISASCIRTATSSSRTAPRTSSFPAARISPPSKSRTRSTSIPPCRPPPWWRSPTTNGARRPAPSSN